MESSGSHALIHFHVLIALFFFLISVLYVGGRNLPQGAEGGSLDVFQSLLAQEVAFPFDSQLSRFELFREFPKQIFVCVLSLFAS